MATSGSARHAPRPEDGEPFTPGDAVADVHAHTRRSDGVLEPRRARPPGPRRRRSGCSPIADHDNLAAYRELVAPGAPPLPADLTLVPAVEINAVTRGLGLELPEGELHVLGIGVDPTDDAFEAPSRASAAPAARASTRPSSGCARSGCRSTPSSGPASSRATTRWAGRRSRARSSPPGYAESVEDAFRRILGHGLPGYVPRTGLGPVEAIHAIRAAAASPRSRTSGRRPTGPAAARAHRRGARRPRDPPPLVRPRDPRRRWPRRRGRSGLVETGGTDYHGDLGPYADGHAGLVMPDALVAGLRTRLASTRAGAYAALPSGWPGGLRP